MGEKQNTVFVSITQLLVVITTMLLIRVAPLVSIVNNSWLEAFKRGLYNRKNK
jgi:hypothetical protein